MRRYSQSSLNSSNLNESWNDNPGKITPGNGYFSKGVTNHYTPIENIITNINNLFGAQMSIVCNIGEDGVSIKLYSTRFTTPEKINSMLYAQMYNDLNGGSLYSYITQQGLPKCTTVKIGQDYVVYFSPDDIAQAEDPVCQCADKKCDCDNCCGNCCCPCPCEMHERALEEAELGIITEDESEEELKDVTMEKILELIDSKDKVKAAKQLEILVSQQMNLPREYYFAGIKFKDGDEAIALRWKYTKKNPKGKTVENTRSIIHIFGKGDDAVWVQDYAKDSLVQLPDDVKKVIDEILELLEAEKTNDPAIYKITGEKKERENKEDKDDEKDDKKDDEKDDKKDDNLLGDDNEDDSSRGDDSDDLL